MKRTKKQVALKQKRDRESYHRRKAAGTFKRAHEPRWRKTMRQAIAYIRANSPGAMVEWADKKAMSRVYENAAKLKRETGIDWSVDHIVPLLNNDVCGLHCEANLQILEFGHNRAKNCYWFERDDNVDLPFAGAKPAPEELIPGLEDRSNNPPWRVR